ncbi:MAG: hypothetical protein HYV63_06335 [Candidatus Schekmanbacteria bacterium]|nr:hypothetical protein [Candidatus Schekmanbacteria bacterium]
MEMGTSHGIQYGRTLKVSGIFWGNFLRAGHAAAFAGDPRRLSPADWVVEELSEGRLFIHEPQHVCDARGEARGLDEVLRRSLPVRNRDAREEPPYRCAAIISRDLLRRIGGAELLRASRAVRAVHPIGNGDVLAIWVGATVAASSDLREALWPIWPIERNNIAPYETSVSAESVSEKHEVRQIEWVRERVGKRKALFGLLPGVLDEPVAATISCHLVCTTAPAELPIEGALPDRTVNARRVGPKPG